MMPPISTFSPSHTRIHVHLDRHIEKAIEQHRAVIGDAHRIGHVRAQILLGENHLHGAAPEHVRGTHDERIAHLACKPYGLLFGTRARIRGLLESELRTSSWKRSRSSAMSIDSGEVPMIGAPASSRARPNLSGV